MRSTSDPGAAMRRDNKHSHKSQVRYLTTLKGMIGMLRSPEHTESVFDIEDGLRDIEATRLALEHVRRHPAVASLIEERYLAALPDIAALDRMPAGTLGKSFARHILDRGFDPDYFRKVEVRDDLDWVLMRLRQTHDLWHVLTGFDTDRLGELGLKAFELAQVRRPMAAVITSGGVMRYMIKDPDRLGEMLWSVAHGYRLGSSCEPFLAQKWELGWGRQLADWREQLGVAKALRDSPYLQALQRAASDRAGDDAAAGEA
jgi:ubiquinone biosynthesis protein Coq4